tara:strand:+ start:58 stop:420 length:363 start_codon:yes stop_codon:yes gene_type:complete
MPTDKQLAIKQLIEENKQLHMDTQKQNHNLFSVALELKNKIKKLEKENKDLREKYIEQKKLYDSCVDRVADESETAHQCHKCNLWFEEERTGFCCEECDLQICCNCEEDDFDSICKNCKE